MKLKHTILTACTLALASTAFAERNYLAWGHRYDTTNQNATTRGVAVATDRRGNVCMTGYRDIANDTWYTVKYDALTGLVVWEKSYSNGLDDRPTAITTDSLGNVIVTGYSTSGTNHDFYTIKYAAADGAVLWERRYNNAAQNGLDDAVAVAVDSANNVIVAGNSFNSGTQEDFFVIKYTPAGAEDWSRRYNSPGNYSDKVRALAIAPNGDALVVGSSRVIGVSNECYCTIRLGALDGIVLWDETYDYTGNDTDVATDVAVDSTGAVLVSGIVRGAGDYSIVTLRYNSGGGVPDWARLISAPDGITTNTSAFVGTDALGAVYVAGTADLDGFKTVYTVTKYDIDGNFKWNNNSTPPGSEPNTFVDDVATSMVVDNAGNVIVTGVSGVPETGDDYLTMKFDAGNGDVLWGQRLNGQADSGTDIPAAVAVDSGGNVAVTGTTKKASPSAFFEITTLKYNRFLLTVGDPVKGTGLTEAALISALNVPATADDGGIVARISVKDGKKSYAAILPQAGGGGNTVSALQGQPAPGIANAEFKSFSDPVSAPNGTYAFGAKVTGAPAPEASGVWTNAFGGQLLPALQTGKQVPGLPAGTLLKSVLSISLQNNHLVALISVKGTGVTAANSTVLLGITNLGGTALCRTGQDIMADGAMSSVKKLSVFTPPKTSPGQGRYHGSGRTVASVTLADKRVVLLSVLGNGTATPVAASGGDAASIAASARWKSFGPYGAGSSGLYQTTLATLAPKLGGVTPANDSVIFGTFNGTTIASIAREGATAPAANGATYASFSDPVSNNQGNYAFIAKLKGGGSSGANNTAIYFGNNATPGIVARTGSAATDAAGFALEQTFTGFKNFALPGGIGSGPIFLATVKGAGASGKNNFGLWGVDSEGFLRQLLRNGDVMGDYTVKKFTLLNSVKGALSASRTFNNAGAVTALVGFTDKTQAIVRVGIP